MAEQNGQSVAIRRPYLPRTFRDIWEEMDRLWESFPRFPRLRTSILEPAWPAIDVYEKDGSLVVKADVPGMKPEDIDVTISEDGLTISGQRQEEKEVKDKDYYRCERSYGSFVRQIALPAGADRDKAEARFKDGVLEVRLPLSEGAKHKKIEIQAT
ncbi:MAG TPA: Hsp20/alpha crystallin family protein [Dehalococcoidia bacterium]|nr:Hsp20/alpha crystallin family protein [Dehalococcoidia bacterium]